MQGDVRHDQEKRRSVYVASTFGGLSVSHWAKGAAVCFCDPALWWGERIDRGFLNCAASYTFNIRRVLPTCPSTPYTWVLSSGPICSMDFHEGVQVAYPSKLQRSPLPNGKSTRTNQVQNLDRDQGVGQTVILNSLSVFQATNTRAREKR